MSLACLNVLVALAFVARSHASTSSGALVADDACLAGEHCAFNAIQRETAAHNHTERSRQSMSRAVPDQAGTVVAAYGVLTAVDLAAEVDLHYVNSAWGNCSYPGLLIPNLNKDGTTGTASVDNPHFVTSQVVPQKLQASAFTSACSAFRNESVLKYYDFSQAQANKTGAPPWNSATSSYDSRPTTRLNLQGSNDGWQTDSFAAELIGNSMIATFLEETEDKVFVLDLSDSAGGDSHKSKLQSMKQAAVRTAPLSLLRCKGFLTRSDEGAVFLTKIKVLLGGDNWIAVSPEDGTQWSLAKSALHSIALFTLEVFHTAVHVYSAEVVTALQNSVPKASLLGQLVAPQTLFVLAGFLEQMGGLHNDHPSTFNGEVYACNITAVRATAADIARFFLASTPEEILGIAAKPSWWAGNAASFIEPIEAFATTSAQAVFNEGDQLQSGSYTELLGQELSKMGMTLDPSALGLGTEAGLAAFFGKTLFIQSIWHTSVLGTREYISPLGLPSTQELAPFLAPGGVADCKSLSRCFNAAIPVITQNMVSWSTILFDTGLGYGSPPELGDGPYAGPQAAAFGVETARFNGEVGKVREELLQQFGLFTHGHFKPGYYYPKCQPSSDVRCLWKPYGFSLLSTVYV